MTSGISHFIKYHSFAHLESNILTRLNCFDLQVINLLWARTETKVSQFPRTTAIASNRWEELGKSMICLANPTTGFIPYSAEKSDIDEDPY